MAALSTIYAIASVAIAVYTAKVQKDRAKKAAKEAQAREDAARGMQLTVENTVMGLGIPYGRCKIGGARTLVYVPETPVVTSSVSSPVNRPTDGLTYLATLQAEIPIFPNVGMMDYGSVYSAGKNKRTFSNSNLRGDGRYISKNDRRKNFHQVLLLQQAISVGGINQIIFALVDGKPWNAVSSAPCVHLNTFCDGNEVDPLVGNYGFYSNFFVNTAYATGGFWIEDGKYYDVQFGGVPDVQFFIEGLMVRHVERIVEGSVVYYQTTNPYYSNNPALCLLDYLMNSRYGLHIPVNEIDLESFYNAMIICESPVMVNAPKNGVMWYNTIGQRVIKRFECNIILSSEVPIRENINKILESMDMAELIWSSGKYKLQLKYPTEWVYGYEYALNQVVQALSNNSYDIYKSLTTENVQPLFNIDGSLNTDYWAYDAAAHITDDDIIQSKDFSITFPNAQTRYNSVTVKFRNEALDFMDDTAVWPRPSSLTAAQFLAQDNLIELKAEIYAEAITTSYHAYAKAEQICRTSRMQDVIKVSLAGHLNLLETGDVVHFSSELLGIPGRLYMIATVQAQPDNTVDVTMNGFDARMLAWNAPDEALIETIPYTPIPLEQASSVAYAPSTYTLTWVASNDARVSYYTVFYTRTPIGSVTTNTTWTYVGVSSRTSMKLPSNLSPGIYTFAVVATTASDQFAEQSGWPLVSGEVDSGISEVTPEVVTLIDVTIYKRASTIPSKPTDGVYDFNTMSLSVIPAGWFTSIPTGVDPVWQVTGTVEHVPSATTFNMANAWSNVVEYAGTDLSTGTVAILSPDAVVVLQDYYGNNFGYDGANGVFQVFVDGVDKTQTADVNYVVVATTDCDISIDNITGVSKGRFEVTSLTGNLGAAMLRATIDGVNYDRELSITTLNEGYILDPTPPPAAEETNVLLDAGTRHLTVNLVDTPDYSEGHGHGKTRLYYCKVPTGDPAPEFVGSATLLGEFEGLQSTPFVFDANFYLHDYDHYAWVAYITRDGYEGAPSNIIHIDFVKITTSDIEEFAVTTPVSAESFSSLSPLTLASTDFGDSSVLVTVNASGLLANTPGESAAMEIRRDTVLEHTIPMLVGTQEIGSIPMASGGFSYIDYPGLGEHIYELTVTGLDSILHQSISAVGLKR